MALIVLLVASFAAMYVFEIGHVGFSMQVSNGQSVIAAGSSPIMLLWAALSVAMFVVLMRTKGNPLIVGIPTWKRRAASFFLDFWFSLLTLSSFGALLPLWIEALRTGRFSWTFERNYRVASDDLFGLPLVLGTMGLMFLYFVFPLTLGKQTVGCLVMRLRVTPPFGDEGRFTFREAARRTLYEFMALSGWPLTLSKGRDSYGRAWHDRATDCRVVLVEYK